MSFMTRDGWHSTEPPDDEPCNKCHGWPCRCSEIDAKMPPNWCLDMVPPRDRREWPALDDCPSCGAIVSLCIANRYDELGCWDCKAQLSVIAEPFQDESGWSRRIVLQEQP